MYLTTWMVTGKIITSYKDFKQAWVTTIINSSYTGINPPNAIGKNRSESALSPIRVEVIALREKCFPWLAIFILLMMYALRNEPARKANRLAIAIRGHKIETFFSFPKRGCGQKDGNPGKTDGKEIHGKTAPDD